MRPLTRDREQGVIATALTQSTLRDVEHTCDLIGRQSLHQDVLLPRAGAAARPLGRSSMSSVLGIDQRPGCAQRVWGVSDK